MMHGYDVVDVANQHAAVGETEGLSRCARAPGAGYRRRDDQPQLADCVMCSAANASSSRSNRFCGSSRPTAPMAMSPRLGAERRASLRRRATDRAGTADGRCR